MGQLVIREHGLCRTVPLNSLQIGETFCFTQADGGLCGQICIVYACRGDHVYCYNFIKRCTHDRRGIAPVIKLQATLTVEKP